VATARAVASGRGGPRKDRPASSAPGTASSTCTHSLDMARMQSHTFRCRVLQLGALRSSTECAWLLQHTLEPCSLIMYREDSMRE